MHFVTGGAFNGKSAWVKAYYQIGESGSWFSAYRNDKLPRNLDFVEGQIVVLEGIERWIKELLTEYDAKAVRDLWSGMLKNWSQWELDRQGRMVCIIGSDMTKGIVPLSVEDRIWRDTSGRIFQDTAAVCERVEWVWYGIGQRMK